MSAILDFNVNKLEYAILLSLISLALLFYSLLGECGHAYVKKSACSQNKTKIYINAPSCDGDARTLHSAVRYGAAMRGQEKTTVLITFTFASIMKRFRKLKRLHVAWEVHKLP